MADTYKKIEVIPGTADDEGGLHLIPQEVKNCCDNLEAAIPTLVENTSNQAVNREKIHSAAFSKVMTEEEYEGVEIAWIPHPEHIIDPNNGAWIPIEGSAVAYEAEFEGDTYSIGFRHEE